MAFDQITRNRLQKFVSDARKLISEEFTRQLQNTYGLDPVTGNTLDLNDLPSLSPREQQTAKLLRDTLEHYLAASHKANPYADKVLVAATLDRIVREQAFTVLNRLAAIRMAEARQFVMESVSQGYQSKGFQLYQRIADNALGGIGQAYKLYLFSVFDELSLDLAVLFDRYSPQGRLFPRETVLLELLDLINHAELELLWAEDETIGWIYQYFNSKEERKKMRDESSAPRNSRELAVRNQFFTPRYVVEFLTDNTLGRIWYEMTKGQTTLVDSCQYLVRRPNEVFLKVDQQAPETEKNEDEAEKELSQEELLQQTLYIQHRSLKDPRDIKMLDPACGSMHFGLYAFDLFEKIYSEAWDLETSGTLGSFVRDTMDDDVKQTLHESYESKEAFLADVPRLIIEHNIHGVDIDSRALQIAGLSLWLRAQKSWADNAIQPNNRPPIQRSNIVCAEPMPGEKELLKEFTSQIQPRVLGNLVAEIFEKMQLAGEAGILLKVEEEIENVIAEAKKEWEKTNLKAKDKRGDKLLFTQAVLDETKNIHIQQGSLDLSDIADARFWEQAEHLIMFELERYADSTTSEGSSKKRLFASDAAKGFAFIDLCCKRFDVVLMNPPFGELSLNIKKLAKKKYASGGHDILTSFVEEGDNLLSSNGLLGAITSRTCFFAPTTRSWRQNFIQRRQAEVWVDLGPGVLDDAMVETSAYVIRKQEQSRHAFFIRMANLSLSKLIFLLRGGNHSQGSIFIKDQRGFDVIEGSPFAYWTSDGLHSSLKKMKPLESHDIQVKVGLQTGDDFRFIRCWWEIECFGDSWYPHAKGGDNKPFVSDIHLAVNWKKSGNEITAQPSVRLNAYSKINPSNGLSRGLTFPYRTHRFSPAILPEDTITGVAGMGVYAQDKNLYEVIMVLNSSVFNELIDMRLGLREINALYQAGTINPIAYPILNKDESHLLERIARDIISSSSKQFLDDETCLLFDKNSYKQIASISFEELADNKNKEWKKHREAIGKLFTKSDSILSNSYNLEAVESNKISSSGLSLLMRSYANKLTSPSDEYHKVISYLIGQNFGRWDRELKVKRTLDIDDLWTKKFYNSILSSDNDLCGVFDSELLVENVKNALEGCTLRGESVDLSIETYFSNANAFFADHLKRYSKSRRQAPIYWPLQTLSCSYTLWVYYHSINEQTIYTCINDFVDPKLKNVAEDLIVLQSESSRNSQEEREMARLSGLELELKDFRDELLRLAKFWKPNINDGVQITAAPLWKLFQHRPWKDKLKKTWEELEQGKCDWSHMAYNIWPERVLKKCYQDRSIAIAHDVEADLWEQVEVPITRGTGTKFVWQPKELTDSELDAYIQQKITKDKSLQ